MQTGGGGDGVAVVGAVKTYGVKANVDVTHLRVSATMSIKSAQKLFGTKWDLYATGQPNQDVALPVNTPKLGSGLNGNVDTVWPGAIRHPACVRELLGVRRPAGQSGFGCGRDANPHWDDQPGLRHQDVPRGRDLDRRPVS